MKDEREHARRLELPPLEDVERGLDLEQVDRGDRLPGLYRMNVIRMPLARLVGFTLCLVVLAVHNRAVLGGLGGRLYWATAAGVLGYCLVSWGLLRALFARLRRFHMGTVFVWMDLLAMTAIVYAGGGERSLMWPVYFVRVADQLWISRKRAAALAAGGVASFALLLLWLGVGEGRPLDWPVELFKLLALASMSAALALVAVHPLEIQERTVGARDLIARLEEQSIELDEERIRAEAASRAKSDFLARMSHELRTPLNSVVGFTNVLLRNAEGRDREYLKRIQSNGMHLLALVDDILDLARIEEGRMQIRFENVDVSRLVQDTVRQLEGRALGGPVALTASVPDAADPIRADEPRLRQVLVNLVGNALKFTERGSVVVEVEPDPRGGAPVAVHVRDTGIGIARDRIPYIFQPFEQADGTTSRKYGGAGLGLAISRSLCELMGMSLSVVSDPGRGSTFTVDLRAARVPAPPTSPAERPG